MAIFNCRMIAVYLIANEKAVPFYEKLGMKKAEDVMQYTTSSGQSLQSGEKECFCERVRQEPEQA